MLISPSMSSSHSFQDHLQLLFLYRSLEIMLGPLGSFKKWQSFYVRIWSLDMTKSFQQISVQESTVGPSKSKMTVARWRWPHLNQYQIIKPAPVCAVERMNQAGMDMCTTTQCFKLMIKNCRFIAYILRSFWKSI